MRSKSLLAAVVLGLAGLLSSCVSESGPYGYNGYTGGYYSGGYYGGTVIYGGNNWYRPRYRTERYRYRNDHRSYHRHGRPEHSMHHRPEYRRDGRPGGHYHRIIPPRTEGNK